MREFEGFWCDFTGEYWIWRDFAVFLRTFSLIEEKLMFYDIWKFIGFPKTPQNYPNRPNLNSTSHTESSKVNIYVDLIDFMEMKGSKWLKKTGTRWMRRSEHSFSCSAFSCILIWFFSLHKIDENFSVALSWIWIIFSVFYLYNIFSPISINLNLKKAKKQRRKKGK